MDTLRVKVQNNIHSHRIPFYTFNYQKLKSNDIQTYPNALSRLSLASPNHPKHY